MTHPNSYESAATPYQPSHVAPQQSPPAASDDWRSATGILLTLFGIVASPYRQADSSKKGMKVVMVGGLAFLVMYGALLVHVYLAPR